MDAMVINIPVAQADPYAYPYEDGFSTTFWSDFSIADPFGKDAVRDTFNRASKSGSPIFATSPISLSF